MRALFIAPAVLLAAALLSCGPPPPPVVVVHGAKLSWTVPFDQVFVTRFTLYRAAATGGPYTLIITLDRTVTTYLDATAPRGSTFFYVVTDTAGGIESVFSNEVSVAVP